MMTAQTSLQSTIPAFSFENRLQTITAPLRGLTAAEVYTQFQLPEAAQLFKTTLSLCDACLEHCPAAVYALDGRVYLSKRCDTHGFKRAVIENDARFYRLSSKDQWGECYAPDRVVHAPAYGGCCGSNDSVRSLASSWRHDFTDQRANKTCTVLVEITNACNLSCRVCYADSRGDRVLSVNGFKAHIEGLLAEKSTLDSVQITGGEASIHPEFWQILHWVHAQERIDKVYLPTNGIEFAKAGNAERLSPYKDKVLVLLQFDGAMAKTNQHLRRAHPVKIRERLIRRLNRLGVRMQLTMTLAHGISEREIAWVVRQGLKYKNVRLIGMLPAFYAGRYELDTHAEKRLTLSDVIKGITLGFDGKVEETDFMPIPCSHPNCGWVTLFARRFGLVFNIARHVDLEEVKDHVSYKTQLSKAEMQGMIGTGYKQIWTRLLSRLGRKLIRPQDVFGIAIKPFMDPFTYDQDRVSSCCHHMLDTDGRLVSFCEYNTRFRHLDSWTHLDKIKSTTVEFTTCV